MIRKRKVKKKKDDTQMTRSFIGPKKANGQNNHALKLRDKPHDEMEIKVSNLGKGQIIGFNDLIANRLYSTSVKCISSQGSVFEIKADEF